MTRDDLRQFIAIYGPGLEAEITLLRQLERLAAEQHGFSDLHDIERLTAITQERDRIMAALVKIEAELKPAREALATNRDDAMTIDGYDEVAILRRAAADLVATIIKSDDNTILALKNAEAARQTASQTIGVAGSTFAAYRRVLAPPLTGAGLISRRG
jgi:hypothetical protein